jgi:HD superfamily phosphohydrolase
LARQTGRQKYCDFDLNENDKQFIRKLIDPPGKEMRRGFENHTLHEVWDSLDLGRPFEDVWMFEVVSNWRSGLDVDRIDYFQRDSQHFFG